MKRQNYTVAANIGKCNWCGTVGKMTRVKVSLKRTKPACIMCTELFKPIKPELPIDKDKGFSQFFWRIWLRDLIRA